MFIVDAHLDLSYNALRGRDLSLPAFQQRPDDEGTPTVGLPDLHTARARLVCATIFVEPVSRNPVDGYRSADEAHQQSVRHLQWYQEQVIAGRMQWVRNRSELEAIKPSGASGAIAARPAMCSGPKVGATNVPFILLMEGADALRSEADVAWWWQRGLRMVGLAWKRTLLAGGTGDPGPLTPLGRTIAAALDRTGVIHDASHLAEESFWELLDLTTGPVVASHSNARALIPTDRQLSDAMARAIAHRGGVIGINLYGPFLVPPGQRSQRPAQLADAVRHVRHFADVLGGVQHIGLGTDLDGGFGREDAPLELNTIANLPMLAQELSDGGFDDAAVAGIMGGHWMEFFTRALPAA